MNSRATIFHEAEDKSHDLVKSIKRKEFKLYILDMDNIQNIEKAKILYNHLYYSGLPLEYFEKIKESKNYLKIIKHRNYNPRIIEFITSPETVDKVQPSEYFEYISAYLDKPDEIWKNEYDRRLQASDRILLTTLYSLTDTIVPLDIVRQCYNHRLMAQPGIDFSVDQFQHALHRLHDGMIKKVDKHGVEMLSAANPSINDFLKSHLDNNPLEIQVIVESALSLDQLYRLMSIANYSKKLSSIFANHAILNFIFLNESDKYNFISWYCADHNILDEAYRESFSYCVSHIHGFELPGKHIISSAMILSVLSKPSVRNFYHLTDDIFYPAFLKKFFDSTLDELISPIIAVYSHCRDQSDPLLDLLLDQLQDAVNEYCTDIPAYAYDVDIPDMILDERYHIPDIDSMVNNVENQIRDQVEDDLHQILSPLPKQILSLLTFPKTSDINILGADSIIEDYLEPE